MPDILTKRQRSAVMSLIRSTANKDTELRLAVLLRARRIQHAPPQLGARPTPLDARITTSLVYKI